MVLRWLIRYFGNNEQFVNRLADSYPIRRAARLVVYLFAIGRESLANPRLGSDKLQSAIGRFQAQIKEAKEEFKVAAEELKKKSNK